METQAYSDAQWNVVRRFVAHWYTPLTSEDGISSEELQEAERRLGVTLPLALQDWYMLAGKREDINSVQNRLLWPSELHIVDNRLVFYMENQHIVAWGIPLSNLEQANPPVEVNMDYLSSRHSWIQENSICSEFIMQMLLHQTLFSGEFTGNTFIDSNVVRKIEAMFPSLAFPDWHWPSYPTRFFGNDNIIVVTNNSNWMWVRTYNKETLTTLVKQLDIKFHSNLNMS